MLDRRSLFKLLTGALVCPKELLLAADTSLGPSKIEVLPPLVLSQTFKELLEDWELVHGVACELYSEDWLLLSGLAELIDRVRATVMFLLTDRRTGPDVEDFS